MATYKVIQDIEAEDKLLGPLTFRQFVYAGICAISLYLTYLFIAKGVAFMAVFFFPFAVATGFFAWPWSRDQPTEIWALAKIRFMLKPRRRIWDQSGTKELVTITAPKKIEAIYTNGLSQTEVENRLKALADTIDSRGWAIKNVNVNMFNPAYAGPPPSSDRLVSITNLPQPVPDDVVIEPSEDMLEENNPVARQFDTMIAASSKARREELMEQMRAPDAPPTPPPTAQGSAAAANYWFLNQPTLNPAAAPQNAVTFNTQLVTPGRVAPSVTPAPVPGTPTPEEEALIKKLEAEEAKLNSVNNLSRNHWHTIKPLSEQQAEARQNAQMQAQAQAAQQRQQQIAMQQQAMAQAQPQAQQQQMQPPQQVQRTPSQQQPAQSNGQPQAASQQWQQQPVWQPPAEFLAAEAAQRAAAEEAAKQAEAQVTQTTDPAILRLATNDDLNVATLAREANKRKGELQDEVVISLH